jgi:hypothetical protein
MRLAGDCLQRRSRRIAAAAAGAADRAPSSVSSPCVLVCVYFHQTQALIASSPWRLRCILYVLAVDALDLRRR